MYGFNGISDFIWLGHVTGQVHLKIQKRGERVKKIVGRFIALGGGTKGSMDRKLN